MKQLLLALMAALAVALLASGIGKAAGGDWAPAISWMGGWIACLAYNTILGRRR